MRRLRPHDFGIVALGDQKQALTNRRRTIITGPQLPVLDTVAVAAQTPDGRLSASISFSCVPAQGLTSSRLGYRHWNRKSCGWDAPHGQSTPVCARSFLLRDIDPKHHLRVHRIVLDGSEQDLRKLRALVLPHTLSKSTDELE